MELVYMKQRIQEKQGHCCLVFITTPLCFIKLNLGSVMLFHTYLSLSAKWQIVNVWVVFFPKPASARALLSFHRLSSLAGQRQWQQDWTTGSSTEWNELQSWGQGVCVFECVCVCLYLYEGTSEGDTVPERPLSMWSLGIHLWHCVVTFLRNMLTHRGCWARLSLTPCNHW